MFDLYLALGVAISFLLPRVQLAFSQEQTNFNILVLGGLMIIQEFISMIHVRRIDSTSNIKFKEFSDLALKKFRSLSLNERNIENVNSFIRVKSMMSNVIYHETSRDGEYIKIFGSIIASTSSALWTLNTLKPLIVVFLSYCMVYYQIRKCQRDYYTSRKVLRDMSKEVDNKFCGGVWPLA